MRDSDKLAIAIQDYFFNSLENHNIVYQVATDEEQVLSEIARTWHEALILIMILMFYSIM